MVRRGLVLRVAIAVIIIFSMWFAVWGVNDKLILFQLYAMGHPAAGGIMVYIPELEYPTNFIHQGDCRSVHVRATGPGMGEVDAQGNAVESWPVSWSFITEPSGYATLSPASGTISVSSYSWEEVSANFCSLVDKDYRTVISFSVTDPVGELPVTSGRIMQNIVGAKVGGVYAATNAPPPQSQSQTSIVVATSTYSSTVVQGTTSSTTVVTTTLTNTQVIQVLSVDPIESAKTWWRGIAFAGSGVLTLALAVLGGGRKLFEWA
jgi:hypothetical protein